MISKSTENTHKNIAGLNKMIQNINDQHRKELEFIKGIK